MVVNILSARKKLRKIYVASPRKHLHGKRARNGAPMENHLMVLSLSFATSLSRLSQRQAIDVTRSTNRRCSCILPFRAQNTGFHRSHGPQQPRGDLIIFERRSSCLNTVIYSQLHGGTRYSVTIFSPRN